VSGFFDTHAHLEMLEDLPGALAHMREAGVERVVTIGTHLDSSGWAIRAAAQHDQVFAAVGIHPHDARDADEGSLERIAELAASDRVVGVGETGLDYHYDNSPRPDQRRAFAEHISIAKRVGKALIIHCRDAWEDIFDVLEREGAPDRVVFHCWSGSEESARCALALGAVISFSGTVTFKNATKLRGVAETMPLESMVVETDSPFLTPVPHRGKRNEPAHVRHVAEAIASVKGVEVEEVATATTKAAAALFGL
jgi:TatD DNase family protein